MSDSEAVSVDQQEQIPKAMRIGYGVELNIFSKEIILEESSQVALVNLYGSNKALPSRDFIVIT